MGPGRFLPSNLTNLMSLRGQQLPQERSERTRCYFFNSSVQLLIMRSPTSHQLVRANASNRRETSCTFPRYPHTNPDGRQPHRRELHGRHKGLYSARHHDGYPPTGFCCTSRALAFDDRGCGQPPSLAFVQDSDALASSVRYED